MSAACPQCRTPLPAAAAACPRCHRGAAATQSLPADAAPASARPTPRPDAGSTPRPDASATDSPPVPRPSGEPELPARIGRFEVREWLGEGTFAEVYLGYDPHLDREVALKVAKPGTLGTPRRVKRFLREARAAGNLRHPNIVPLHETGEDGGRHFLVAAYIRGRTLGAVIDEARGAGRPLPLEDAARFARRLAEALAYAHGEGIVHRDVKPDNVMADEKGEPLLMDFGLAARAEPEDGEERLTQQGVAVGTPAYMAPEQARADLSAVGPAADQYALGCVLFELLTGQTPFAGPPEIQLLLHQTQPPPSPRKLRADVPRDLETICLKCLEKEPTKRYPDCQAVADDLRRWLDGEPISARRPGPVEQFVRWVRRNPGRAAAAVGSLLVVVGGVVAAFRVQQALADQRLEGEKRLADQRLADEKQRADERIAAEEKRLADLRAADEAGRLKQREARAMALVQALASADTVGVPRLLDDLSEYKDLTGPRLRELAAQPVTTKPGLHGRLALLGDDPGRAAELAAHVPTCRPEELLTIGQLLKPHAAAVAPRLLAVATDATLDSGRRVRAAAALAGLAPDGFGWVAESLPGRDLLDTQAGKAASKLWTAFGGEKSDIGKRVRAVSDSVGAGWGSVAPALVDQLVRENPLQAVVWAQALEPVRGHLVPALLARYPQSRQRIETGKLGLSDLVAEASAFDQTANLLARYTTDRPKELAELAVILDARHYPLFAGAVGKNRDAVVPALKAALGRSALPAWAGNGEVGPAAAAVLGAPAVADVLNADAMFEAAARRKGHAAAVLLTLGEAGAVWPVFAFPKDGDPTARSYLLQRLAAVGADPVSLMRRYDTEAGLSARRALVIALGDFPVDVMPVAEREAFAGKLLVQYREHPDPGLHGAIDWLLRQRWGKANEVATIDAELAAASRAKVLARGLADLGTVPPRVGPLLPAPGVAEKRDWFVNGEGQTYAVIRNPEEFTLGSPATEPGRYDDEVAHRKRIGRTYAIATKEVTVEQFLRFRPRHGWTKRYSPGPDTPAVSVTWYDCAAYCNWLSEREGIPPDQWCYEPNKDEGYAEGMRMKPGHLNLTGYRLPTEAEWEFACRAGSVTARYYGRGEELLPRYGWFVKNAEDRAWPVGGLRPNELGLFDALGNASEWLEDPALLYVTGQIEDIENSKFMSIDERMSRLLRGGSFFTQPVVLRSASRSFDRPGLRSFSYGFRPARTLLD